MLPSRYRLFLYICIVALLFTGLLPFNFLQNNKADQERGLRLTPPSTVYTQAPPRKLSDIKQFTILLNLCPGYRGNYDYARIVTYSLAFGQTNFTINQREDGLVFGINTDEYPEKMLYLEKQGIFKVGKESWIAIVFNGDELMFYQDGQLRGARRTGKLTFTGWVDSYPLVFGSEANGTNCWNGMIYSFAIFSTAFVAAEIQGLSSNIVRNHPLIYYDFTSADRGRVIADLGSNSPANLTIPHFFAPYKRTVLAMPRQNVSYYQHHLMDIFVNIAGFLPLGFLLAANFRNKPVLLSLSLSMALGFVVSFTIEAAQIFLPSHSSDVTDLICNTLGAFGGAALWCLTSITRIGYVCRVFPCDKEGPGTELR
jgi:VanZ family protein